MMGTVDKVVDGDTLRVEGVEGSLRLLCIDTEEVFHPSDRARARELAERSIAAYERSEADHADEVADVRKWLRK